MPNKQPIFVPNLGGLRSATDLVALRNPLEPTTTHSHLLLSEPEFLRSVRHSQIARDDCWLGDAVVETRVLVGYEAYKTGSLGIDTPLVAIWHPECGCAMLWNGGRHQAPSDLMREVLALVPRFLTVRERLDRVAAAIQLMVVGDFDWHRYLLTRLFRELTTPAEMRVRAVSTGVEAQDWVEGWEGALQPVLLVSAWTSYEASDLPGLEGSIVLAENVGPAAKLLAWDPGEPPSQAEEPLREAGFEQVWDRRLPLEAIIEMVLDAAGVIATVQHV